MSLKQRIAAANRFGLGAAPDELNRIGRDPRAWLVAQLDAPPPLAPFRDFPSSLTQLQRTNALLAMNRAERRMRNEGGRNEGGADAAAADRSERDRGQMQKAGARQRAQAFDRQAVGRHAVERSDMPAQGRDTASAGQDAAQVSRAQIARDNMAYLGARYRFAATTQMPFVERLTRFWSNHFAVSADKNIARAQVAPMEREAIRPHVLGNFAQMLVAVEQHPAMLLYLDNAFSVGDASRMAATAQRRAGEGSQRARRRLGINENLAREILELHTLGVDAGYTQTDVRELARAISGWSTPGPRELSTATSAFSFRSNAHEPGARIVLGKRYAEDGEAQGRAILRDLALHPATARHLSMKLARHFVADEPPAPLLQAMANAYLRSGGELKALYRAMIGHEAAWSAQARKFKTPDDFVVSALRAGGGGIGDPRRLMRLLDALGQPVFTPRSPAGFPDTAGDWASGDALRKRIQAAAMLADFVDGGLTPYELALATLGEEAAGGDLGVLLRRAGSPREGYALLFSSPAFQWRT